MSVVTQILTELERGQIPVTKNLWPLVYNELRRLALDEPLDHLARRNPRASELVKLCFFVGLTQEQAAEQLGVSGSSVARIRSYARARRCRDIHGPKVL